MGVTQTIDLTAEEREVVQRLLQRHLPGVEAWVYGSRAKWTSRPESDLDLVVFATPEQSRKIGDLREAFEESNLPFRVDLFVWSEVPEQFHQEITRDHVVLVGEGECNHSKLKWPVSTIEEVSEKVAMGPFGSAIKVETFVPDGVPIISGKHLHGAKVDDTSGFNFITEEHAQQLANANVRRGDVVFTHAGNIGQVAYIPEHSEFSRYVISQRQFYMRCNRSKVIPEFLTAYFRSHEGKHKLLANTSQVGVPSIAQPVTYLRTIEIPVPPLPEQRAIAHILGTLDDKIELNRGMNETLEAMAHALFKSWFVDFDPVRAKMTLKHHPPEGESVKQGRSPPESRWGEVKHSYSDKTLNRAKSLRRNQTDAEVLLWHYLRNKQLDGYKFRRQQPIGPYIIDFACLPEKLLIELDGGQHAEREGYDERRDRFLQSKGYRVLRFWNNEVFENCFDVLEQIYQGLTSTNDSPLEGESANQGPVPGLTGGRQPAGAPVEGNQIAETDAPPPHQPSHHGSPSATPPQGGSDWTVERARAYLDRMDPKIADLFPDRLVDSELGEIPEGWDVKILGDLLELTYGKALKADNRKQDGEIPVYGSNGQVGWHNMSLVRGPGIVVGRKGNPGTITWAHSNFFPIDTAFYVVPKNDKDILCFLYFALKSQNLSSLAADSAVPGLNRNLAYMNRQVTPASHLIESFRNFLSPVFSRSHNLEIETRTLASLRNTLLPKLISGEIRLCDADQAMEAMV